jgi:hypothetical protein
MVPYGGSLHSCTPQRTAGGAPALPCTAVPRLAPPAVHGFTADRHDSKKWQKRWALG